MVPTHQELTYKSIITLWLQVNYRLDTKNKHDFHIKPLEKILYASENQLGVTEKASAYIPT